ncbi:MAG TPA: hypothetical protein ENN13_00960 [Candidatus Altiarchaeales archaeon]|nr:hypothetical protein [Candidatus Altiarchaeales archaeon]
MDLPKILSDSLAMFRENPKIVLPRLITTMLYAVIMLYLVQASLILKETEITPIQARDFFVKMAFILASTIILYILDVYTYAMYPQLAKDYKKGLQVSLVKALKKVLAKTKTLIGFSIILFSILGISTIIFTSLITLAYTLASTFILSLIILVSLIALLAAAILLFFIIPVAVIDDAGLKTAASKGFRLSMENKKPLLKLNLFFLLLLLATSTILYLTEFEGALAAITIIVFAASRLLQAVVYTYICIANPIAYLSLEK